MITEGGGSSVLTAAWIAKFHTGPHTRGDQAISFNTVKTVMANLILLNIAVAKTVSVHGGGINLMLDLYNVITKLLEKYKHCGSGASTTDATDDACIDR